MTHTRTFVTMDLSPAAYEEVASKLREAGYKHAFHDDGEGRILLDMHGIACGRGEGGAAPSIAELQADIWRWTISKGWGAEDDKQMGRTIGDLLMLMVSELSEAYEEHRKWHEPDEVYVHAGKPEGIPIELADCVIRILSFAGKHNINLQQAILDKMAYNETREHRHGGKRA